MKSSVRRQATNPTMTNFRRTLRKWPYVNCTGPLLGKRRSCHAFVGDTALMMGMMKSFTRPWTTSLVAAPITTATASANMFCLMRNARNSCHMSHPAGVRQLLESPGHLTVNALDSSSFGVHCEGHGATDRNLPPGASGAKVARFAGGPDCSMRGGVAEVKLECSR